MDTDFINDAASSLSITAFAQAYPSSYRAASFFTSFSMRPAAMGFIGRITKIRPSSSIRSTISS